jgi:hypothetical protein
MPQTRAHAPFQIVLIAAFQFIKAGFLLCAAALILLDPNAVRDSDTFSQLLVIATRGKNLSGILLPALGFYLIYIGFGLLRMRKKTQRNLAISSVITICGSLQRLGVFGEASLISWFDRETLYILILLDLAVYIYLAFHPDITGSFDNWSGRRSNGLDSATHRIFMRESEAPMPPRFPDLRRKSK